MTLLKVEGLSVGLGAKSPLPDFVSDLSFALDSGECLGLTGESGAGKTLTSLALAGLLPAPLRMTGGRILIDGTPLSLLPSDWRQRRGRDVLVLFQSPLSALDPIAPVVSQVADSLVAVRGLKLRAALALAESALGRMGLSAEQCGQRPHQLSGGMRQRVLLAFAWALRPRILIADEPASGLDPMRQVEILDILRTISSEEGVAVILISHDLRLIAQLARRVAVLEHGRLVEEAPVCELLSRPRSEAGKRLASAFERLAGGRHG